MSDRGGRSKRVRQISLHVARVSLFASIILLIHFQHAKIRGGANSSQTPVSIDDVREFFPEADSISDEGQGGGREVLGSSGDSLGHIVLTSPESDYLIGFSGPTNTLIAFDPDQRIVGIKVISSGDTRDHVAQVVQDNTFMKSFDGLTREEVRTARVDAVSGATLTSLTIQESIIHRLAGATPSLRFPDPVSPDDARDLFESAKDVEQDNQRPSLWHVRDASGNRIGSILRTSPAADNIVGYQGPTEARIGLDVDRRVLGVSIGNSYDNEHYVGYVRKDDYFLSLFNKLQLKELADLDLEEAEIEGVSGATMTSMSVAKGLIVAARQQQKTLEPKQETTEPLLKWTLRDFGTSVVVIAGLIVAFSRLRGNKLIRIGFQLVLIVYLGLINGDLLSQAMFVGWAQAGVPWSKAGGLVLLTAAAFIVPITSKRNAYCSHLCPHGAAQQLLKNRLPMRLRLSRRWIRGLRLIPGLLLAWCVVVAMTALRFSLVDIEPFDAWVFRVAGWATIIIAVVGLIASLFVPMAYCRYGCPTGALLDFLKFNSRSDRWSRRDWVAAGMLGLAVACWLGG